MMTKKLYYAVLFDKENNIVAEKEFKTKLGMKIFLFKMRRKEKKKGLC